MKRKYFLLVLFLILAMFLSGCGGKKEKEINSLTLKTSVEFTGTQFVITNNDYYDWLDVKMEINKGASGGGYIFETERIEDGETYTVGALQFAKKDGLRFNPLEYKPQDFSIYCILPAGSDGSYFGTFK